MPPGRGQAGLVLDVCLGAAVPGLGPFNRAGRDSQRLADPAPSQPTGHVLSQLPRLLNQPASFCGQPLVVATHEPPGPQELPSSGVEASLSPRVSLCLRPPTFLSLGLLPPWHYGPQGLGRGCPNWPRIRARSTQQQASSARLRAMAGGVQPVRHGAPSPGGCQPALLACMPQILGFCRHRPGLCDFRSPSLSQGWGAHQGDSDPPITRQ